MQHLAWARASGCYEGLANVINVAKALGPEAAAVLPKQAMDSEQT